MSITLRKVKNDPLTFDELDINFSNFFFSSSVSGTGADRVLRLHYTGSSVLPGSNGSTRYHEISLGDASGGTGGSYVDLSTAQTVGGSKTFTDPAILGGTQFNKLILKRGTGEASIGISDNTNNFVITTGGTNALTVDPNQNIGIGFTGPGSRLDVDGDIQSVGDGSRLTNFRVKNKTTGQSSYIYQDANNYLRLDNGTGANRDIAFNAGSTGSVNIGHLNNRGRLGVLSSISGKPELGSASNSILTLMGQYSTFGLNVTVDSDGDANLQAQRFDGSTTVTYNLNLNPRGGNIGLGTFTPNKQLELRTDTEIAGKESILLFNNRRTGTSQYYVGGIWAAPFRDVANPGYGGGIDFKRYSDSNGLSSNTSVIFYAGKSESLTIARANNKAMVINYDKTIEIGNVTSNSNYKLNVEGNTYINGSLRIGGSVLDNGNSPGSNNQVLSSTGAGVTWVDATSVGGDVGNGTLTVTGTGVLGGTGNFSANQSTNNTINISHDTSSLASGTYGSLSDSVKIDQITIDGYGHITGISTGNTGDITEVVGGNAINVTGGTAGSVTVNHADTSTQGSVSNTGNNVIQSVTLDTYGHITSLSSKGITIGDGTIEVYGSGILGGGGAFTTNTNGDSTLNITHDTSPITANTYGSSLDYTKIDTITVDTYGHITNITTGNTGDITEVVGGNAINVTGGTAGSVTVNHADTSGLLDVAASPYYYVSGVDVDGYGHVQGVSRRDGRDDFVSKTTTQSVSGAKTFSNIAVTGDLPVSTGSIGVGVTPITTDGNISALRNVIAYASDNRLKENRINIGDSINKIKLLNGFTYNWNELAKTKAGYDTTEKMVGVSAQEIKKVLPEAVKLAPFDNDGNDNSISGENYLTVQYEKIVPLLIEGMKEQQSQIEFLQEQINELKNK